MNLFFPCMVSYAGVTFRVILGFSRGFVRRCHISRDFKLQQRLKQSLPSSKLLHNVRWFDSDVSGTHICVIFKVQARQLKMGEIDSPETSVSNSLTLRNNLEGRKTSYPNIFNPPTATSNDITFPHGINLKGFSQKKIVQLVS